MQSRRRRHRSAGFTLIELLIVIAVVAILAIVVVLVLNPAEILKQGRDTGRLADIATLKQALGILQTETISQGTLNTVYISLPDMSATSTAGTACAGMGLPSLPSGWSYHCPASSTLRAIDGTGWLPVNLKSFSSGAPLPFLPVDPQNSTSTGNYYYTYSVDSSGWKLAAGMESSKQAGKAYNDGGNDPLRYEDGSSLNPASPGPVLWLKADSIAGVANGGTIATWNDSSGNGYDASQATGAKQPTYSAALQNGQPAVTFNGTSQWLSNATFSRLAGKAGRTVIFVSRVRSTSANKITFADGETAANNSLGLQVGAAGMTFDAVGGSSNWGGYSYTTTAFTIISSVYDGSQAGNANRLKIFQNGAQKSLTLNGTIPASIGASSAGYYIARRSTSETLFANADIGEILVYDTALGDGDRTAAERYLNAKWGAY